MKKIFVFLFFIMIFWMTHGGESPVYSQPVEAPVEAFEVTYLPRYDSNTSKKISYSGTNGFCQIRGHTYFPGTETLLIINDTTKEFQILRYPYSFIGKCFAQPYSDKIWFQYPIDASFSILENGEFGEKKIYDTTINDLKLSASDVGVFPPKEWEQYYTKDDACIYYILSYGDEKHTIVKRNMFSPEKVIYEVEDTRTPADPSGKFWITGSELNERFYGPVILPDSTIWFVANNKYIVRFDEKTMKFDNWNVEEILNTSANIYPIQIFMRRDEANYKNSKVYIYIAGTGDGDGDRGMLHWDNEQWNFEKIDFTGSKIFSKHKDSLQFMAWPLEWGINETAFCMRHLPDTCYANNISNIYFYPRLLMIYNHETKKVRDFIIPIEAFKDSAFVVKKDSNTIQDCAFPYLVKELEDGRKGIYIKGLAAYTYVVYDPKKDPASKISDKIAKKEEFYSIYPNPASDKSFISLDISESCELKITLSDILGREILDVHNGFVDSGNFTKSINTSNLSKGVYFLKISIDKDYKVEKFIVE